MCVFALTKGNITVAVLRAPHSTARLCVLDEFTLANSILDTHDAPVDSALSAGHIYVINVLTRRGFETEPPVVFLSLSEKALGASLAQAPGLRQRRQCFDSSQCSNPGRDPSTDAGPGGNIKHATRPFSP
eukprot:5033485-Pyramimonas_sp.AAC.1